MEKIVKNDHRPINVDPADLMRFAWPVMALASITHRITGVIVFVCIGFGLYALDLSLSSESGFVALTELLGTPFAKLVSFVALAGLGYHFVAGIKHMFQDMEMGETLEGGKFAAKTTLLLGAIMVVLAGIWVLQF